MAAGLTSEVARARLETVGKNQLPAPERRRPWQLVIRVLREPMVALLVVATALYVALGDRVEAAALAVSVAAVVSITVLQERRSERALEALRELATPRCQVLRDGRWREIDVRELVPGDLVRVGEGDRVPADVLVREGTPVTVDESLLTGESVPLVRTPDPSAVALPRPGDVGAGLYAGTLVVAGHATAEVIRTGVATEFGRIGAALGHIELTRAPLHREVLRVVRRVAVIALALSVGLAGIYVASGHGWLAAALAGVTLAMSLLPEELPLVLTVFLTLGAWRIARHRVLTRHAASIETLGAVTLLAVDKTGTLTVNRMQVQRIATATAGDVDATAGELPEAAHAVAEFGLLACPHHATDATDLAFAALVARTLAGSEHVHPDWSWEREYPLSPSLLAVTHVWRHDRDRRVVATKGAPEAILDLCHLEPEAARAWRARAESLAADGLRVLGVARASHGAGAMPDHPHDYAFEMVGLVGLADPLRDDTRATIATCHAAGVRVLMITGDHPTTARAIARAAGLRHERVVTGAELEALDPAAVAARLRDCDVVARATPAHKLRIVEALRADGEVVGMTGDGVNDAPALKAADVGVAMGRGTHVAREAAGLVLLDDALGSLVAAIRVGRTIYDNLRKVAAYLVAVHIPIAGLALVPPLVGWPLLLAPVHIVLLELVIDPTCSVVFELEPPAAGVMRRRPRGRRERLFDPRLVGWALVFGCAALVGPLVVAGVTDGGGASAGETRALGFAALVAADLALVYAVRRTVRGDGARNPAIRWMVAAVLGVLAAVVLVPGARGMFAFEAAAPWRLALAMLCGAGPVLAVAVLAAVMRRPTARTDVA